MSTSEISPITHDLELLNLLDTNTLERLLAEHPHASYTIVEAYEGPVAVVFRRLTSAEFKRGSKMVNDSRRIEQAAETIANDVILHPRGPALEQLREECPGLNDRIGAFALRLAKGEVPEEVKKLRPSPTRPLAATSPSTPAP